MLTDYVLVRSGRVFAMVYFVSFSTPLESTLKEELVSAVAGRMP